MPKITLIFLFSLFIFCTPFCVGGVYSNRQKSLKVHNIATSDYFPTGGKFPSWVEVEPSDHNRLLTNRGHIDIVVAADGSGNYTRVMDAMLAAPIYSRKRFVIYIKKGIYYENIWIDEKKTNLMVMGDGIHATIISSNLSKSNNLSTYKTATFGVIGRGFIAQNMSFRNSAGPKNGQAVALVSDSDLSVFYQYEFSGYQDTLYARIGRQFYRDCVIRGTVDFIFGYATTVFQNCHILVKKGLLNQKNTITAHGGKYDRTPYGFVFQFCSISADLDLLPKVRSTQTFLGRPWGARSTTIFMESYMGDLVSPEGWMEWNGTSIFLDTLYYAEYKNHGPGARVQNRVKWTNYHLLTDSRQAIQFTVAQFISGGQWLSFNGVPFIPGLGAQNATGGK